MRYPAVRKCSCTSIYNESYKERLQLCPKGRETTVFSLCCIGARGHGHEGALAPPSGNVVKCFICISSYSKMR